MHQVVAKSICRFETTLHLMVVVAFIGGFPAPAFGERSGVLRHRDEARQLALDGADAFVAKDFVTALDRFQRAGKLYDAPTITIMEARAMAELGQLLEASDRFRRVEQTVLTASATRAFRQAVRDAAVEGAQVRARLAHIQLRCSSLPKDLLVYLDGTLLALEQPADGASVNPGTHVIRATARGYAEFERTLVVREHQTESVDIELRPLNPSVPLKRPMPKASSPETLRPAAPPVLGVVSLVTSGAAFAIAGTFYVVAWREKASLEARCTPTCPYGTQSEVDRFRLHRGVAYATLGVGIAAAGFGSYMIWRHRGESVRLAVELAPDHARLRGDF
jgi:hypothetical protein